MRFGHFVGATSVAILILAATGCGANSWQDTLLEVAKSDDSGVLEADGPINDKDDLESEMKGDCAEMREVPGMLALAEGISGETMTVSSLGQDFIDQAAASGYSKDLLIKVSHAYDEGYKDVCDEDYKAASSALGASDGLYKDLAEYVEDNYPE